MSPGFGSSKSLPRPLRSGIHVYGGLAMIQPIRLASAALAAFFALAIGATAATMKGDATARYGGSVYTGAPDLPLTLSMVEAGGGPKHFKTTTLVGVLAGKNADAEVAKLTK